MVYWFYKQEEENGFVIDHLHPTLVKKTSTQWVYSSSKDVQIA